jgi:DNA replication protein
MKLRSGWRDKMKKEKMLEWLEQGNIVLPTLLINSYTKLGLNENEFMLLLHVHTSIESGNLFPTPDEISSKMTLSEIACTDILRKLLQKGFIKLEDNEDSEMIGERYSLKPLWEKMLHLFLKNDENIQDRSLETNLYTIFEQEFGRPLSPMEIETMSIWLDQENHTTVLIKAALKEAVLSGKMNFRYIDRILFDWKKNGISTIEQAKQHGQRFRKNNPKQQNSSTAKKLGTIPFYNWLEQE